MNPQQAAITLLPWSKRSAFAILPIVCILCTLWFLQFLQVAGAAPVDVCTVPGSHATIQDAVDDENCTTIQLGSGTFVENVAISRTVTIAGQGALNTIVDGNAGGSVFYVHDNGVATFAGLTIRNGLAYAGGGIRNAYGTITVDDVLISGNEATGYGGGISSALGHLTIRESILSMNSATVAGGAIFNSSTLHVERSGLNGNSAQDGGGIQNNGGNVTLQDTALDGNTAIRYGGSIRNYLGTVTVSNSTFYGNSATMGGGIYSSGRPVTVTHSIFADNTARFGGGIANSYAPAMISNSTFDSNRAANWGGAIFDDGRGSQIDHATIISNSAIISGGGIFNASLLTVTGSIVAHNAGRDCDGLEAITSAGYNIAGDNSCAFAGPGDMNNTDPLVGPLQDNGGPTYTHALLEGSPAIDAGNNDICPATDQRGALRPADGDGDAVAICDIGAYELGVNMGAIIHLPLIRSP